VMVEHGGCKVPAHKCGKGKRSRSLVRAVTGAAVVSDTSHFLYLCISSKSSEHLLAALQRALRLAELSKTGQHPMSEVPSSLLLDLLENPGQQVLDCCLAADKVLGPCMVFSVQQGLVEPLLGGSSSEWAYPGVSVVIRVHSLIANQAFKLLSELCKEQPQGRLHLSAVVSGGVQKAITASLQKSHRYEVWRAWLF
jgi:hypothetical protein